MDIMIKVCAIIIAVLAIINAYKKVFDVIGLLKAKTYEDTDIKKKYGFIISARNEELVIGNLVRSIQNMNYDQSLITIFVVADNCSENDKTAEICRELGCVVYERHDPAKARKGWALEYLFDKINEDYGVETYDAFVMMDADNLMDPNYMTEMNKAVVAGKHKIIMGYRNTKNFDSNIISAAYGVHWYKASYAKFRARSILGFSASVSGTGFIITSDLVKDGYHYHSLTEDCELTCDLIAKGHKVGYCEAAEFYDEQPTNFFVSCRQRIRWTRGRLFCFCKYSPRLMWQAIKRRSFSCFDFGWSLFPYSLVKIFLTILCPVIAFFISLASTGDFDIIKVLKLLGAYYASKYVYALLFSALYSIREIKHIKCPWYKLLVYLFFIPWFDLVDLYISVAAVCFPRGKWHPVKHKDARTEADLERVSVLGENKI